MSKLVDDARRYAVEMHDRFAHTRSNGEPYWRHPERVAATLAAAGLGEAVLAAAWMHDVAEDCAADAAGCEALLAEIGRRFGEETAGLVREVTNFFAASSGATMEVKQQRLIEHAPHLSAGAKWIKLGDRFDNISGMDGWSDEKKQRYARATLRLIEALRPLPTGAERLAEAIGARARAIVDGA